MMTTPTPATDSLSSFISGLNSQNATKMAAIKAMTSGQGGTAPIGGLLGSGGGIPSANGDHVVAVAQQFAKAGIPYVWGGNSTQGTDCSGLVQQVYARAGVNLPRTSQQQAAATKAINPADARPGDLVFYDIPGEGANSHVGIYIGNGQMIDAAHTGTNVRAENIWQGAKFGRVGG